jgi:hypothetical protein
MAKLKPLYKNLYKKQETSVTVKERQRQHRIKLISVAIITLVCMVGTGTIMYFAYSS